MPKPATRYDWDTNGTHVVAPTAGHQSDGYAADEIPASDEWNGLFANWSAWLEYLEGGAFEGASSFDNTLGVTGLLTADGGIDCNGAADVSSDLTVGGDFVASGSAFAVDASGNLTWDGMTLLTIRSGVNFNAGGGGTLNNLNIDQYGDASIIQMTPGAGANCTGFAGGVTGRVVRILVLSNSFTFTHNSGSSSVGNKFACPGSSDLVASANTIVTAIYTGSVWMLTA